MDLRQLRKTKGLSQLEAAQIAGVTIDCYKNHELGRSKSDSALGKLIYEKIMQFEPYGFDRGVLSLDGIKEILNGALRDEDIDFAYLFGSYAKGEADERSDIDLLIFGAITGLDFFSLGGRLERALHKKIDVIRFDDIADSNREFLKEILATGFRIYSKEKDV